MNKWRLFKHPLQVMLKNAGKVFVCVSRLYDFCTNERLRWGTNVTIINDDKNQFLYIPSDQTDAVEGNLIMRDILVDKI